jgi:hypothetical protein
MCVLRMQMGTPTPTYPPETFAFKGSPLPTCPIVTEVSSLVFDPLQSIFEYGVACKPLTFVLGTCFCRHLGLELDCLLELKPHPL